MAKKKKNNIPDLSKHNPLEPLDLASIGSTGDPCFGKQYDLSTSECRSCGDSEACAFKMSQLMNKTRKQLEEENHYKDLDILEDVASIKKYMRKMIRAGKERREIIQSACKKFEVPSRDLRKIYKELKK